MMQLKDNMSNIEKIRKEIERLMKETEDSQFDKGERYGLKAVLEFIGSLPEEKPLGDLEEAADEYARLDEEGKWKDGGKYKGFIAGAKWQANQLLKGSPLPEDTVLFQKGVEEGKRLLMEEAVEGEIVKTVNDKLALHSMYVNLDKSHFGDKVKIIIIKDND